MAWEKVKLEDLYDVHNGLSKGGKFFGSGYPFLTFSTVFNNFFIPERIVDLVQSTEKEQENYSICRGDVFITRTSETSDELGMSCVALKDYPFATYNGFTKRLRPKTDCVLPEYIGYYMRTPSFRGEFIAFSTMTTRASLRNEDLLSLKVALPPLKIQKKIADILSAYDNLIENNQKQIKLLEEAAQRLYKEWFIDLRFPGHETTKIVDGIPTGWQEKFISELCLKMNAGGTPSRGKKSFYALEGHRWFKTKELLDNWLIDSEEHISDEGLAGSSAKLFPPNTIVMAIYASPTLGRLGIMRHESTTNQAALCMAADSSKCSWQWLFHKLYELRDEFNAIARGAGQQNISGDAVKSKVVVVPTKKLMDLFTKNVEPIFEKMYVLTDEIEKLKQTRDRLLPKLMSGEIEV